MEGRQLKRLLPFAFAGTDTTVLPLDRHCILAYPTNVLVPVLHKHTKGSSNQLTMSDLHTGEPWIHGQVRRKKKKQSPTLQIFIFLVDFS
jgi:hypothetical protein